MGLQRATSTKITELPPKAGAKGNGAQTTDTPTVDPIRMLERMARITHRSQKVVSQFLARQADNARSMADDPLNLKDDVRHATTRIISHPERMVQTQLHLFTSYLNLWQSTAQRMMGAPAKPVVAPTDGDNRFKSELWERNAVFSFIKQAYLLNSNAIQNLVRDANAELDEHSARKINFYTRQFVDAWSPTNFVLTNPEVLKLTMETGGENLLSGLENFLDDVERGKGNLSVRMTDLKAFEVGRNVGCTPGKVVYRNDLMELIQYNPTTEQVSEIPVLIIPPWINKFYILDLQAKNSMIKWLTDQGNTVFVISWVNPDEKLAHKSFDNYMNEGPLAALEAIEKATGSKKVNAAGYCLGGTLLSGTLAYMAAKKDNRIASATFFATLTDFSEPGDLCVFIDEKQIGALEVLMKSRGYLDGGEMATTFNLLRDNDLIWSFMVHNYLKGKDPFPMDLLYWNSDATRMPAAMHSFYLRNMYLENRFCKPGGIELNGTPIDLRKIKIPVYMIAAKEDHIAPWKSTYAATQLFSGPVRFVLGASGHIAGIVNHPAANRYNHWVNESHPENPDDWFKSAAPVQGSWWLDWQKWLEKYSGEKVAARQPGDGALPALVDAPGTYVKARLV